MKQPNMFHKHDADDFTYDAEDTDDDAYNNNNNTNNDPVNPIVAAIQRQQAKKTARLPKNNVSDPMRVIVHNHVKLAGVQAKSAKRIITLLANKSKYDPKTLSNMTELLQTNAMKAIALLFKATLNCYERVIKSDEQKRKHLHFLEKAFKDISGSTIRSTLKVKIKSMA